MAAKTAANGEETAEKVSSGSSDAKASLFEKEWVPALTKAVKNVLQGGASVFVNLDVMMRNCPGCFTNLQAATDMVREWCETNGMKVSETYCIAQMRIDKAA